LSPQSDFLPQTRQDHDAAARSALRGGSGRHVAPAQRVIALSRIARGK
jgi:hypothetical protein